MIWIAILAGAVAALGQAPVGFPFATLVGLGVGAAIWLDARSSRDAALRGWALGLGYFAAALFWIVEPFFVDPQRHGWMAPFALVLLAGGLALFWGAAGWIADLALNRAGRVTRVLGWAAALAGAEALRSYLFTGFPWALVGHAWVGWAPMHLAALVGPVGLSLLTLAVAGLGAAGARGLGGAAVLGGAAWLLGAWWGGQTVPGDSDHVVRLVQPNAAQHLKWNPDHALTFFDRQLDYTAADAARRPDLIIWPETAIPTVLERAEPWLEDIAGAAQGVPVVLGIQRWDGRDAFNSLVVLDGGGSVADVYDKHHLVPFGEYVPGAGLLAGTPLASFVEQHGFGFTPGPGARLVDLGPLGRALPLICYEAIFPQDVAAAPERPGWLLQVTNDAWFGRISGPYQHLAQARLRAVEQGLPMVRVANTGVSAVIDARGTVRAALPLNEAGFLDAALPGALSPTPYARAGDGPVVVFIALIFAGLWATSRRARRRDG